MPLTSALRKRKRGGELSVGFSDWKMVVRNYKRHGPLQSQLPYPLAPEETEVPEAKRRAVPRKSEEQKQAEREDEEEYFGRREGLIVSI